MSGLHLVPATDAHFAWLLGEAGPAPALTRPPRGLDEPWVLKWLRGLATRFGGVWLMVDDGEVVGCCTFKGPPEPDGTVSLGYGIAPERRGRGYATLAVTAMVAEARGDPCITRIVATTAVANIASQRVLERNGFERTGLGYDADDGDVVLWRLELSGGETPLRPATRATSPRKRGEEG